MLDRLPRILPSPARFSSISSSRESLVILPCWTGCPGYCQALQGFPPSHLPESHWLSSHVGQDAQDTAKPCKVFLHLIFPRVIGYPPMLDRMPRILPSPARFSSISSSRESLVILPCWT